MESLARCLEELRKSKLDFAGPPPSHELPRRPFGLFKEPSFEQKVDYPMFQKKLYILFSSTCFVIVIRVKLIEVS